MATFDPKLFKFNKLIISSFAISIITLALSFLFFSFPANIYNEILIPKPFVSFHNLSDNKQDRILDDQAMIFDTKPIFLPSEWNEVGIIPNKEIDQDLFTDLPPQITLYNYKSLSTTIPLELSTLASLHALDKKSINLFNGINQNKTELSPPNVGEAHVIIKNFDDSKIVKTYEINDQNTPIKEHLWVPLEFLVIVDESGPIMPPLMTQSSGIEEIDVFFKHYISTPLLKLSQLPIGYYHIVISP